ncbi:hypothetical protein C8K30_1163 [Promicromonospora sp. AC04]|uniref:hypothetical protein n=1 Tax=Promicromonospora sp. AC04 TaxID=2135723 RepID=UPI000D392751|nr:hypothetical protein [Promicromonospora sp. AC04]PUB20260.1 hypothetical protein C8K30_1163 [Promicromonospora sp. AC04]
MRLYAAAPARCARQVLGDLMLLAWIAGWAWVGRQVHESTLELAGPGRATASAADDMAGRFHDVEGRIGGLPGVGDDLAAPFSGAAEAAESLAAAGRSQVETVEDVALLAGIAVFLIPVLLVAVLYVPLRIRFVRRAYAARHLAGSDPALLALRALANQPLRALTRISDDPVGAWRDGDPAVVRRLADLELRDLGLRR